MPAQVIKIIGARQHNLKNLSVEIPREKLVVITGLSGSGKSSLAFDTLYAEGQRRYVESLSSYARQFLGQLQKPDVDYLAGLSPSISIQQKAAGKNPRSTVGTITEIHDYLRVLYARVDGQIVRLTDDLKLDRRIKHNIEIVVDRLKIDAKVRSRLAEAVEQALNLADGNIVIVMDREGEAPAEPLEKIGSAGASPSQ